MQLKPTAVIAVLSFVVASLLVTGCTDTQETTQSNAGGVAVAVNSVKTSSRIGNDPIFAARHILGTISLRSM
jgi:hypothetical protein